MTLSLKEQIGSFVFAVDGEAGRQIRCAVVDAMRQYRKGFLVTTNWIKHSFRNPGEVALEFSSKDLLKHPVFCPEEQINQTCEAIVNRMISLKKEDS